MTGLLIILASLTAAGITTAGILLVSSREEWVRHRGLFFKSFAAGILLTVTFLHVIPEATEMNERIAPFMTAGFFFMFLVSFALRRHLRHHQRHEHEAKGIIPVLGIGFHSFIDGIIYAVTFNISIFTGALAALALILHELPEGIVSFALLQSIGYSRSRARLFAILAAGFSTPLGAALALPLVDKISDPELGVLLAIAAGVLTYVGATHLLPEAEEAGMYRQVATVFAGVAVAVAVTLLGG